MSHPPPDVLRARQLGVTYRRGTLWGSGATVQALQGIDLRIAAGEIVGVVGPSGCGKSTLARCLALQEPPSQGRVDVLGIDAWQLPAGHLQRLRPKVQRVDQSPAAALDPRFTVGRALSQPLRCRAAQPGAWHLDRQHLDRQHLDRQHLDRQQRGARHLDRQRGAWHLGRTTHASRVHELLQAVDLDPSLASRPCHALSGGQKQRVVIARALAAEPRVIVFDEPLAALDAPQHQRLLGLLRHLHRRHDLTYVWISHDLHTVARFAQRVLVLDHGRVVEQGPSQQLWQDPQHAVSRALMEASQMPGMLDDG